MGMSAPEKLSRKIRTVFQEGSNFLSVISFWEVALKSAKGKLEVGDPRAWWEAALSDFAATALPLRGHHVAELCNLPSIHQDPFDRILIAQARIEDLTFVTTDEEIGKYADDRLRVIR